MGAFLGVLAFGVGSVACAWVVWFFVRGARDAWQAGDRTGAIALGAVLVALIFLAFLLGS